MRRRSVPSLVVHASCVVLGRVVFVPRRWSVGALERWSVVYVVVKTDRCSVDNLIDTDTDLVSSLSFRVVLPGFACMMHAGLPE